MKLVQIPDNNKGSYVDFTATDFGSLRSALLEYMRAVYPTDYNNFVESDLGMMLVELVSYMGTVMSMKADMLAHENFIQTAKDRDSVRKLFELVGVSLKGPTSAQTTAEITAVPDSGDPPALLDKNLELAPNERVVVVTSPEDQEALTFSLYKAVNGVVSPMEEYNANLLLTSSLNLYPGSTNSWEVVLLEGAFATKQGTFSDLETFKSVDLDEAPVIQNSVQVFIDSTEIAASGAYRQVENLYQASALNDKIFQVTYDDEYSAKVLFGDGTNGVSPPTNSSYFITYRVGGGNRGNVPNSYINSLITGTYDSAASTFRVDQKQIATGGTDAETVAHAKKYGPLTFRRQDRIVSLEDYAAFASRFTSPAGTTGKATAVARKAYSSANIIDLYILEKATNLQLQKASISFKNALLSEIEGKKLITDDVVIADGLIRTLDLVVTINVDRKYQGVESTIVTKVSRSINNYFLSDKIDFGDNLIFASLNKDIFGADEVIFSTIDNFTEEVISVDFNEIIQLNNLIINVNYV
jgi:hypothetical protein